METSCVLISMVYISSEIVFMLDLKPQITKCYVISLILNWKYLEEQIGQNIINKRFVVKVRTTGFDIELFRW